MATATRKTVYQGINKAKAIELSKQFMALFLMFVVACFIVVMARSFGYALLDQTGKRRVELKTQTKNKMKENDRLEQMILEQTSPAAIREWAEANQMVPITSTITVNPSVSSISPLPKEMANAELNN